MALLEGEPPSPMSSSSEDDEESGMLIFEWNIGAVLAFLAQARIQAQNGLHPPAGDSLQSPDAFIASIVRHVADGIGGGGERVLFGSIGFATKNRVGFASGCVQVVIFALSPWVRTVRVTPLPRGEYVLGAPFAVGAPLATLRIHEKRNKVVVLDPLYLPGTLNIPGGSIWAASLT